MTVKDRYQITHFESCRDRQGSEEMVSSLNANKGYYQIKLKNSAMDKKDLVINSELYRYLRISIWIKKRL